MRSIGLLPISHPACVTRPVFIGTANQTPPQPTPPQKVPYYTPVFTYKGPRPRAQITGPPFLQQRERVRDPLRNLSSWASYETSSSSKPGLSPRARLRLPPARAWDAATRRLLKGRLRRGAPRSRPRPLRGPVRARCAESARDFRRCPAVRAPRGSLRLARPAPRPPRSRVMPQSPLSSLRGPAQARPAAGAARGRAAACGPVGCGRGRGGRAARGDPARRARGRRGGSQGG